MAEVEVLKEKVYEIITGAGHDDTVKADHESLNGGIHITALSLTKTADGLINPKLVLAWLMNGVGAPGYLIGLLVPIREAGALLPQLALARRVEASLRRKWFWIAGSIAQGMAALGIAASALMLNADLAGLAIICCLGVLSLGRSLCSISHKDTLARTIPTTRRGSVSGTAGSLASLGVLCFGLLLALGVVPLTPQTIAGAIALAGAAWLLAALVFSALREPAEKPPGKDKTATAAFVEPLVDDPQLRRFILTRAVLTATALAPPFIVMMTALGDVKRLGHLGPLVLASASASIFSSYLWGRLSDKSSRQTLMTAGGLGAITFAAAGVYGLLSGGFFGAGLVGVGISVAAIFFAHIAHEGIRAGRKLHLTDMTKDGHRARYTALSNSIIGIVLLAGGALGGLADIFGPAWTLLVLAMFCSLSIPLAASLEEVQLDSGESS